ncbi:MAG: hypothetical protein PHC35_01620 [Deltaproteobacteria bacterium]|jgi:hypothetical protein|nr:hypothetical protein [Deltaproteobacteria bacterium]
MDPKGIDLLNVTPVLITQAIKTDRKLPQVIKPVEQSGKSELRSNMERADRELLLLHSNVYDEQLRQKLQTLVRVLQQRSSKKWKKKVGLRWKWQADQRLLCVEFIDEETGALLEEVSVNELLSGLSASDSSLQGLLINKTV